MIVVIMGVAGCGKSTVGQRLAAALGWVFVDADDLHAAASIAKMAGGTPLDDADREPWLARLRQRIDELDAAGTSAVLACSALQRRHRARLLDGCAQARLVYLKASRALLAGRLHERARHFFPAALLDSQLAALEEPDDALVMDAGRSLPDIVADIITGIGADIRTGVRATRERPGSWRR